MNTPHQTNKTAFTCDIDERVAGECCNHEQNVTCTFNAAKSCHVLHLSSKLCSWVKRPSFVRNILLRILISNKAVKYYERESSRISSSPIFICYCGNYKKLDRFIDYKNNVVSCKNDRAFRDASEVKKCLLALTLSNDISWSFMHATGNNKDPEYCTFFPNRNLNRFDLPIRFSDLIFRFDFPIRFFRFDYHILLSD